MSPPPSSSPFKSSFAFVAALGAFGGLLSAAYQNWVRNDNAPFFGIVLDFPVFAAFGIAAAIIAAFWIVPIDRSDLPRLAALALLAGFAWEPVVSNVPVIVRAEAERHSANTVRTSVTGIQPDSELPEIRRQLEFAVATAHKIESETRRTDLYWDIQESLLDIGSRFPQGPARGHELLRAGHTPPAAGAHLPEPPSAPEEGRSELSGSEPLSGDETASIDSTVAQTDGDTSSFIPTQESLAIHQSLVELTELLQPSSATQNI